MAGFSVMKKDFQFSANMIPIGRSDDIYKNPLLKCVLSEIAFDKEKNYALL